MRDSNNFYVICITSKPDEKYLIPGNKYLVTDIIDDKYYEIDEYIRPIGKEYFITISDSRYRKITDILNR